MKRIMLLLTGLLLLAVLLWWADFPKALDSLSVVDRKILPAACLMQLVTIMLINLQWQRIACRIGQRVSFGGIFHLNMAGVFVESVTPAVKAGGEAVKVVLLKSALGFSTARAALLVGLQKLASILPFLALSLAGLLWFLFAVGMEGYHLTVLIASFLFVASCLFVLVSVLLFPRKLMAVSRLIPLSLRYRQKMEVAVNSLQEDFTAALRNKEAFVLEIFFSLIIWVLFAVKAYFIAWALKLDISFIALGVAVYLSYMVAMVPLFPGGLGSFEASIVFLLAPLGVAHYEAVAFALVLRFVTFWFVFLLSALYLGCRFAGGLVKSFNPFSCPS